MADIKRLLQFTRFAALDKWYVEYYLNDHNITSSYEIMPLSVLMTPMRDKIKKNDYNGDLPVVQKIIFNSGEVVFRSENKTGMDLWKVNKGELIVSSINFHQGAIALNDKCECVCSTHYQVFKVDTLSIMGEYLVMVLRSARFIKIIASIKAKGIKNESGWEFIKQFSIPLPPIEVQHSLVRQYNETMNKAQILEQEACDMEVRIDDYLLDVLGIEKKTKDNQGKSVLCLIKFSSLYNWNAKHAVSSCNPMTLFASRKYKTVLLQTVCDINSSTPFPKEIDEVAFLPMECISDTYGKVISQRTIASSTKGYTRFKSGDVIFAKITPCMQNGKCAVVNNLHNGYGLGSTEFHVFRAKGNSLLPEYLHCLLRTRLLRTAAMNYFTGSSGQQRVNAEFFDNLYIPLPSIDIQQKIVEHINTMKEVMKNKLRQADILRETAKKDFERAVFKDIV